MNTVFSCGHFVDGELKIPIGAAGRPIPVYVYSQGACPMCAARAQFARAYPPAVTLFGVDGTHNDVSANGDDSKGAAGVSQLCCGCMGTSGGGVVSYSVNRRGSLMSTPPSEMGVPSRDVMLALRDFMPPGRICYGVPTPLRIDDGVEVVELPPIVEPDEVDAQVIHDLPVVPAAPDLDVPAAEAQMLAEHAAHLIRNVRPTEDESKTDPDRYVCPKVFKAQHRVPWYRRWFNKCCGCVLSKVPSTRRYNLVGFEDFVEGDNRLTAGLSHTMLRSNPRLALYSVVNYDQYDEEMGLVNVDPVTFAKSSRVEPRNIKIPVVVLQDLMAKHATDSITPALLSQVFDSLIRVVNVPFNCDLELKINFTMFCQDFVMWLRDYRSAIGFQNFQPSHLT